MAESATTPAALARILSPDGWTAKRAFLIVLVVSILVSFTGVFDHSLWRSDEPRVAGIGYEMYAQHDYVVPKILGEPFLEKPPIYWWAMTLLYHIFGVSEGVARITSALVGLAALLLVFDLGRRVANPFAGLIAVLVVATSADFYSHYHKVLVDTWLSCSVLFGYWAFVLAEFRNENGDGKAAKKPWWPGVLMLYIAGGLAFLSKGLVGPVLLAGPICLVILVERRWNFLRSWAHLPGLLIFIILCAIWPIMLYLRGGKALLDVFLINNLWYRIHPPHNGLYTGGHSKPFWYYLKGSAFLDLLPWLVALPAAVWSLWKRRLPPEWNRGAILFLAWILPIGVFILSVPGTKRLVYLAPVMAPPSIVIGLWLAAMAQNKCPNKLERLTIMILVVVPAIGLALLVPLGVVALIITRLKLVSIVTHHGRDITALLATTPAWLYITASFIGAALLPLALYGVKLWRKKSPMAAPVAAWVMMGAFVLGGPIMFMLCEPVKSLRPLINGLETHEAFSPTLFTYGIDELTQSYIPLASRQWPKNLSDGDAIRKQFKLFPNSKLLSSGTQTDNLPADIQARLRLIETWQLGRRAYKLYNLVSTDNPQAHIE